MDSNLSVLCSIAKIRDKRVCAVEKDFADLQAFYFFELTCTTRHSVNPKRKKGRCGGLGLIRKNSEMQ